MRELAVRSVRSFGDAVGPLMRGFHFHSLDAVLVAIVWQSVFGMAFLGRTAPFAHALALGMLVWLVYTADRLLDARALPDGQPATARHQYHRNHFSKFRKVWIGCLVCLVALAGSQLDGLLIQVALGIGCLIAIYAYGVHAVKSRWILGTKELHVALLFAFGITVDLWAGFWRVGGMEWATLLPSVLLMASLFLMNCLHVSFAEYWHDPFQGSGSIHWLLQRRGMMDPEIVFSCGQAIVAITAMVMLGFGLVPPLVAVSVITSSLVMQLAKQQLRGEASKQWTGLVMDLSIALPPLLMILIRLLAS